MPRHSFTPLLLSLALLSSSALAAPRPAPLATPFTTAPTLTARQMVQHVLRRFAFSASPAEVTAVTTEGISAWLTTQLNPSAIDDTGSELETLPTQLNADGSYPDYNIFERAVYQHMILSKRELQSKMELHWLDHFAVGLQTVGDPAIMYHYDETIRADALGNFAKLLSDVAAEPAMLIWLSNNNNQGKTPNENFAREQMQLYSLGLFQLNADGSVINGTSGLPEATYTQADVVNEARAMTGYGVVVNPNNLDPQTRFSVVYTPGNHYTGKIKFLGKARNVPNVNTATSSPLIYVAGILANESSSAPFVVKELLQRFVTETPSAGYISRMTAVWLANAKSPTQIGTVISAIINDAEFQTAYQGMPKQPVEMVFDSLRALPGVLQSTANVTPGSSLLYELSNLGQQLFYPQTVFSFYRPGFVETTVNTGTMLQRTNVFANIANANPTNSYTDTYIDIPTLRTAVGSTGGDKIAAYLCDALIDGGTAAQVEQIYKFLGKTPDDNQVRGAIWLLLNSPTYGAN